MRVLQPPLQFSSDFYYSRDIENGCATSGGQSGAPGVADWGGVNHASGRRGRGQQID